jgi:phosphoribosyl-ATP pyrophosphohydrolase/phosphoribosyl-AMP cyclohydrolase
MYELPLTFDAQGLIPVVVQDHLTGEIRMVAFATSEAVRNTMRTGRATFWSRSRNELWEKGRMSGNDIRVLRVLVDCDADCVVYSSEPHGNSCHTGAESCFFQALEGSTLGQSNQQPQTLFAILESVLEARKASTGAASYTKSLYEGGATAIGAKVREEADEFGRALATETDERVVSEAADVVYHLLVGLRSRTIPWRRVLAELGRRLGASGHAEKAERADRV